MKLSVWAKQQGLTYKTAWRMWHEGRLPMPAERAVAVIAAGGCEARAC